MSNYVKATNFTAKDSLPTGNSGKIIRGTEIDTELTAVASAVSSKADINSPTFTGTPAGPTASSGTNTTQLATTAFVTAALSAAYPVGSIYINAGVSTNPATLLGFGTWEAFGAGKVLVGLDSTDTLFDTLEETGGSKNAIAVAHTHTFSGTTGNQSNDHTHLSNAVGLVNGTINWVGTGGTPYNNGNNTQTAGVSADHNHSFSGTTASTGDSGTNANVQPFIVVKIWKRTA